MRHSVLLTSICLLAACQTGAQNRLADMQRELSSSRARESTCVGSVYAKPEYANLRAHVPSDGHPSLAQLADESLISEADRTAYLQIQSELQPCRQIRMDSYTRVNGRMAAALSQAYSDGDALRVDLVQRRLSWGKFETKLSSVQRKLAGDLQAADGELMAELKQDHAEELARRSAAASAIAASMQQQQAQQQEQQQRAYEQQSLINALNRRVHTSCMRFGDQVDCNSN